MKIGIIGAGIAGLASAVRQASKGYEVEVFEANAYPGGKLSQIQLGAYRFDAGPSLFTMPMYVEELFKVAGKDVKDYFEYQRLDVVCHYFWRDGSHLIAHRDPQQLDRSLREQLGVDPAPVFDLLADSRRKYEICGKIFLEKSLHQFSTWSNFEVIKAMLKIPGLDLFKTMNAVNEQQLRNPKLVQLFNRFATYNGSNPYKAPGLLNIIPHFEHHIGAFFPKGGMQAITQSIYRLAKDLGVQFHFNQKIEKIEVERGRATGLHHAEGFSPFDQVISNMDVWFTYKQLLPHQSHPKRSLRQKKSTSALIFYWGIKREFPALDLHNIFFSDNYQKEFDYLDSGRVYEDPTVYVNITKKFEKGDAPEGCENWFTMINVPFNSGQDWDAIIREARKHIQQKLGLMLGIDFASLIECEAILDPRTIESKTASHLGALYGTSSNNRMAAFLRHPNFSRKIKNLYFCGGSVHPGGGIPLCLLSAKIVDDLITKHVK